MVEDHDSALLLIVPLLNTVVLHETEIMFGRCVQRMLSNE